MKELVKFAYEERVVLMADEVYQENIYQGERPFVSARKVLAQLGEPYESGVELLSFHTVSKVREGGREGGRAKGLGQVVRPAVGCAGRGGGRCVTRGKGEGHGRWQVTGCAQQHPACAQAPCRHPGRGVLADVAVRLCPLCRAPAASAACAAATSR